MLDRHPELRIRDADTKRLREEFNDTRIYFGLNVITQELEAWYKPNSSRPYKVSTADNVQHAIRLLQKRMEFDKMRAKDLLAKIDEHNEKLTRDKDEDALHETRSVLRNVAAGRMIFTPPLRSKV